MCRSFWKEMRPTAACLGLNEFLNKRCEGNPLAPQNGPRAGPRVPLLSGEPGVAEWLARLSVRIPLDSQMAGGWRQSFCYTIRCHRAGRAQSCESLRHGGTCVSSRYSLEKRQVWPNIAARRLVAFSGGNLSRVSARFWSMPTGRRSRTAITPMDHISHRFIHPSFSAVPRTPCLARNRDGTRTFCPFLRLCSFSGYPACSA